MRADRFPFALAAAAAMLAVPAPALAKPAKPAPKPGAAAPAKPATPAKPAEPSECCQPAPAAPAAAAPKAMSCCEKSAAGDMQACCKEHAKGNKQACCEAAGEKGDKKEACCDTPGEGPCCSPDKPHAMRMDGKPGMMREERRMEMRHRMGGWGRHFAGASRAKTHELRFMPAMAPSANQYVMLATGRRLQLNDFVSLGGQATYALQLGNAPGQGNWFVPYWGFVPRLGAPLGPIRADVGALLGFGGMLRTGTVGGTDSVLQARAMWVVEPRLELGWQGEHMGVGLVGAYTLNPNMNDFGGPSAGLKFTWKRPHAM